MSDALHVGARPIGPLSLHADPAIDPGSPPAERGASSRGAAAWISIPTRHEAARPSAPRS